MAKPTKFGADAPVEPNELDNIEPTESTDSTELDNGADQAPADEPELDNEPEPEATPAAEVVVPSEPSAAQRKLHAIEAWTQATANPTGADVAAIAAVFAVAPNPRTLLDTCYGATMRTMTSDPTAIDAAALGAVATLQGAIRDALPAPTTAAPKAAAVIDPAQVRIQHLDRMAELRATWYAVQSVAIGIEYLFDVERGVVGELTDDELAHVDGTGSVSERVTKALTALGDRITGSTRARSTTSGDGTPRPAVDTAARDAWWLVPGAIGTHGTSSVRVIDGAQGERGITGHFEVTRDGTVLGVAESPTAAALMVNGGGSVNGRAYWKHQAPAADVPAADEPAGDPTE